MTQPPAGGPPQQWGPNPGQMPTRAMGTHQVPPSGAGAPQPYPRVPQGYPQPGNPPAPAPRQQVPQQPVPGQPVPGQPMPQQPFPYAPVPPQAGPAYGPPGPAGGPPGMGPGGMGPGGMGPGMPPPGGPRRNWGAITAISLGVVAVLAIAALAITLIVQNTGDGTTVASDPTTSTTGSGSTAPSTGTDPGGSNPTEPDSTSGDVPAAGDPTVAYAVAEAMQRYLDALNARDLTRMRSAVCSEVRDEVPSPSNNGGTIVLDRLALRSVTGDVATSDVVIHTEIGSQRTAPDVKQASFRLEEGTWFYCPGTEADIGI
ncbi:hypothetical protein [Gordonia sp. NB41Y]|uniref:hypothetical protein n=1 Tax=Gordonia sp. NB41Y TaxID=875808 RepID=UPI00273C7ADA|nr:hypothetical protein [Gordonia sp. NB41Y]WLP89777.1 hypothetical protein Q9K23_19810 [Gordonia sp. NB41Y]